MAEENVVPLGKSVKTFRRLSDDPRMEVLFFSKVSKSIVPCSFRASMVRLEGAGADNSVLVLPDGTTITLALPYAQLVEKIDEGYSPVDLKDYCEIAFPATEPQIGARMADGSIYAGLTSDGRQTYAMPNDLDVAMTFNDDEGCSPVDLKDYCEIAFPATEPQIGARMADGSIYAGLASDGRQIYAMPNDLDVAMTFNDAAKAVTKMNNDKTLGHDDWQLPSKDSVLILQKNQNKGALKAFKTTNEGNGSVFPGWYWSPTEYRPYPSYVWGVRFSDGSECWYQDSARLSCRPVRLVDAKRL